MDDGGPDRGPRSRARAALVVPFPREDSRETLDVFRVPPGRVLAIALVCVLGAFAAFWLARVTPIFSVDEIEVEGARAGVQAQVRRALSGVAGDSLLSLDLRALEARLEAIPTVRDASLDRAFPHTLAVTVEPERAVAVLRQGPRAYVVSERGRLMGRVKRTDRPRLPRIWVPTSVPLRAGAAVGGDAALAAVAARPLASGRFPARVSTIEAREGEIMVRLHSGLELRLGEPSEVRLKLAVAARLLPLLRPEERYLDVSLPDKPVAGTSLKSQVELETQPSTTP